MWSTHAKVLLTELSLFWHFHYFKYQKHRSTFGQLTIAKQKFLTSNTTPPPPPPPPPPHPPLFGCCLTFLCPRGQNWSLPIQGKDPRHQQSLHLQEKVQWGGGVTWVPLFCLQEVVLRNVLQVRQWVGSRIPVMSKLTPYINIQNYLNVWRETQNSWNGKIQN